MQSPKVNHVYDNATAFVFLVSLDYVSNSGISFTHFFVIILVCSPSLSLSLSLSPCLTRFCSPPALPNVLYRGTDQSFFSEMQEGSDGSIDSLCACFHRYEEGKETKKMTATLT